MGMAGGGWGFTCEIWSIRELVRVVATRRRIRSKQDGTYVLLYTTGRLKDISPLDDDSSWESEHSESSCDTRGGCIACTFLRVLLDAFILFYISAALPLPCLHVGCPFRDPISGKRQVSCDAVLPDADAVGLEGASPGGEISKG